MHTYRFYVTPSATTEEAWDELQSFGATPLYSEELEDSKEMIANIEKSFPFSSLYTCTSCHPIQLASINWASQWSLHGLDYYDGFVHLNLNSILNKKGLPILKLEPGPGFGDLSHPTTRLVIKLMKGQVKNQSVLDIGTGSGVLALAAKSLGARKVWGFDIDQEAVAHAQKNLEQNQMEKEISITLLPPITELLQQKTLIVLMNMIFLEQKEAWNSVKPIHAIPGEAIVSGILQEEKDSYLHQTLEWGWELLEELEEDGWLALRFLRKVPKIGSNPF